MNVQDILALTKAGFTKDDIMKLSADVQPNPGKPTEDIKPAEAEQPKAPEVVAPAPQPTQQIALNEEQLKQLIQGVAVQTASGTVEMPKDLTTTLNERLSSILKGE